MPRFIKKRSLLGVVRSPGRVASLAATVASVRRVRRSRSQGAVPSWRAWRAARESRLPNRTAQQRDERTRVR